MLWTTRVRETVTRHVPYGSLFWRFFLPVLRIHIHRRCEQALGWKTGSLEPERFDLLLPFEMIGEEIARDPKIVLDEPEVAL